MPRTTARVLTLPVALGLLAVACGRDTSRATGPSAARDSTTGLPWFSDRARESGLEFVHFNGMSGELYDAEVFPPGVAWLDYDNDGDLDAYLVQGQMLDPTKGIEQSTLPPSPQAYPLRDRLFRNDLSIAPDGTRVLRFTDVTQGSGIAPRGYGMGIATGDVDNDGWTDIYLTRLGANHLYRNRGNGTFADVSARSGTAGSGWGVSASFVDVDRDGWLDLYVGNYLRYSVETDVRCEGLAGQPDYCPPRSYEPQLDRLYRNRRDGTFEDVTLTGLRGAEARPALGVVAFDANRDGWTDIYVANDGQADTLWLNQRDGTLKDVGLLAGVAFDPDGRATASMGVDAGDFDDDGDDDVVHVNLTGEGHTLLVNDGSGGFDDLSRARGLTAPTLPYTGFGAAWVDVDNDCWLDLLTVNGAVRVIEALARTGDPLPLSQRKQLLRNRGDGRFDDMTAAAGPVFARSTVARGAAFGDVDNDGDVDVLVGNNSGAAELLINEVGHARAWIGLRLVGRGARGRDMLGARAAVVLQDGRTLWRRAHADGSFASANDPRIVFGLDRTQGPVTVRVVWPDGRTEAWTGIGVAQWVTLREGTGR